MVIFKLFAFMLLNSVFLLIPEFEVVSSNPQQSLTTAAETVKSEANEFKEALTDAFNE